MAKESERPRGDLRTGHRHDGFARREEERAAERRMPDAGPELRSARAQVKALEARPRARCRVSQVQTSRGGLITAADEVLAMMLQRPARSLIGLPLASLIAGPERRVFGDRARMLLDGPDGAEWETRMIAPGARIGVPVALSVERAADGDLRWYVRDLTELRRAQARVMELEHVPAR